MMRVASVVDAAVTRLCEAGFSRDEARRDAVVLARAVLGWTPADWLARSPDEAPAAFPRALDGLVRRRQQREPVAYILGEKEFYGRTFAVDRHTLIPRPETEGLVDAALEWLRHAAHAGRGGAGRRLVAVDVGTGSGCLAVTLALESPVSIDVHATDISEGALDMARRNAGTLGAAVTFHHCSLLAGGLAPVDLVISNPPYVPLADRSTLAPDVAEFEPSTALFAGESGLEVVRALIPAAWRILSPGGALMLEIGIGQAGAVEALLGTAGFAAVERHDDLQGIPRIIIGHVPAGL